MNNFWEGFFKQADMFTAVANQPPKPPQAPAAQGDVSQGKTLGQTIGYPGS